MVVTVVVLSIPDRSRGWIGLRRELRWPQIAQPVVRPLLVVFAPIVFNHHPRFRQRPQLLPVQTFRRWGW